MKFSATPVQCLSSQRLLPMVTCRENASLATTKPCQTGLLKSLAFFFVLSDVWMKQAYIWRNLVKPRTKLIEKLGPLTWYPKLFSVFALFSGFTDNLSFCNFLEFWCQNFYTYSYLEVHWVYSKLQYKPVLPTTTTISFNIWYIKVFWYKWTTIHLQQDCIYLTK